MIEMFFTVMIAFAATYALGVLVKGKKFGWVIFGVMFTLMVISIGVAVGFETARQPAAQQGRRHPAGHRRLSPAATWRARRSASGPPPPARGPRATTGSSNGSVNSFHDSFTPIGGLVPLTNLLLGEVTPGGVGRRAHRHARARVAHRLHRRA